MPKKNHEKLLEEAKAATDELFGDTSVPRSQTRESLCDLRGHINDLLDTLKDDAE